MLRVSVACQISFALLFWYVKLHLVFLQTKVKGIFFLGLLIQYRRFEMPVLSEPDR